MLREIRDRGGVGHSPYRLAHSFGTAERRHGGGCQGHADESGGRSQSGQGQALDMFNKGEGGFRDRDLYVFCANVSDGMIVAMGNPNLAPRLAWTYASLITPPARRSARNLRSYSEAGRSNHRDQFCKPKPSVDDTLAAKVSFVTNVGDGLGCAVGYYKSIRAYDSTSWTTSLARRTAVIRGLKRERYPHAPQLVRCGHHRCRRSRRQSPNRSRRRQASR